MVSSSYTLAVLAASLLIDCLSAQSLARDIRPGTENPGALRLEASVFGHGGTLFFSARNTQEFAEELWATGGTSGGLVQLLAFPGVNTFPPAGEFVPLPNGSVLFRAGATTQYGRELHISDGTVAGTSVVRDISPGSGNGCATLLGRLGNRVLFSGDDGVHGSELWISDGTALGTTLVADIWPGTVGSAPRGGVEFQGNFYFEASTQIGNELWRTDGTAAGTTLVKDIYTSLSGFGSSDPRGFAVLGSTLLFAARTAGEGRELWRTDGTPAGTTLVADLNPGSGSSSPRELTIFGGECYFFAFQSGFGRELWKTDGTTVTLVRDIRGGGSGSSPERLLVANGRLVFQADDGVHGAELWGSDGTTAGTQLVADLTPGSGGTDFGFTDVTAASNGSVVAFLADAGGAGEEPYVSDGTSAGTMLLGDLNPGAADSRPDAFAAFQGELYFTADDGTRGRELWKTDGTPTGTMLVHDVVPQRPASGDIKSLTAFGELAVFSADDGIHGKEPWVSDGTPSGTLMLADLAPADASSTPFLFHPFAGRVYFSASTAATGRELWVSDGTSAGTVLVDDLTPGPASANPRGFVEWGGHLYFTAANRMYRTDGTTVTVAANVNFSPFGPNPIVAMGDQLILLSTQGLFTSDGTPAGTVLVDSSNPVQVNYNAAALAVGNVTYFFGNRGGLFDLWRTDGTAAGTEHVFQFNTASMISVGGNYQLAAIGDLLFIGVRHEIPSGTGFGEELWTSDGTAAGTALLADIQPFPGAGSDPGGLTVAYDRLFFHANDPTEGRELWVTDGTSAGTQSVVDLAPGLAPGGSGSIHGAGVGRRVLMFAREPATGGELYVSDGTASGTSQLFDLNPGPASGAAVFGLVVAANRVFFVGDDGTSGQELYSAPLALAAPSIAEPIGDGCAGSAGLPSIGVEGVPALGDSTFAIQLGDALPSFPAMLLGSESRTDLSIGGGCTLYPTAPSITIPVTTDPAGAASVPVPVPNTPALVGAELILQWAAIDFAGPFSSLAAFSRGLRIVVGRS